MSDIGSKSYALFQNTAPVSSPPMASGPNSSVVHSTAPSIAPTILPGTPFLDY